MLASRRVAVLDLGSNTFHLLIVDVDALYRVFKEVYRKREYVYLAKGGLAKISEIAFEKGLETLSNFRQILEDYKVDDYRCLGTATLRSAENGKEFIAAAKRYCDFRIEVVTGQREAELIFKGIQLMGLPEGNALIIDIGGGSLELMLSNSGRLVSTTSKPLGISVLKSTLHRQDPPTEEDRLLFTSYVEAELGAFHNEMQSFEPTFLVGASGAFEIIESILRLNATVKGNRVSRESVLRICRSVLSKGLSERSIIPDMPIERAELSIESMALINYFLTSCESIEYVFISPYALKEGCITEMINLD